MTLQNFSLTKKCYYRLVAVSRAWCGMENGMERKFRYEIWKMPEWNGMEDFKNGMEANLPFFQTNSKLNFFHCIYKNNIRMSGSDK